MIVRHGRLLLARMWHTRKSRWVIDLVVDLGTAIAEDLQVTKGHPCALGEDWDLPDPAGRPIEQVRPIRDDINRRVRQLLADLMKMPD